MDPFSYEKTEYSSQAYTQHTRATCLYDLLEGVEEECVGQYAT